MAASLLRSVAANWIGLAIAGIVGLVLSPIIVAALGRDLFGAWTLVASLTAQLAILDFGVRNSLVAFVARYRADNDVASLSKILSTSLVILTGFGVTAFLLVLAVVPYVGNLFALNPELVPMFQLLLLIYALDAAIELAFGVFNGALAGSERYDVMNGIVSLRVILNAAIVVCALRAGYGVLGIAITALVTRFAQRVIFAWFTFKLNRGLRVEYRLWNRHLAQQIGRYGAWAFLIVVAGRVIYQTDLIVVGVFVGPAAVALYAIAVLLVDQLRMLIQTANTILVPRLSALESGGNIALQQMLVEKWSFLSTLLAVAIGVPLVVNGSSFIALWMGTGFEVSGAILAILALPFFLTAPSLAFSSYLFATSQHSIGARVQLIEATANLILSVVWVRLYGLQGAAWGTVIPAIFCTGVLLPWLTCQKIGISLPRFFAKTSGRAFLPAIGYAGIVYGTAILIGAKTWSSFIMSNALPACAFAVAVFFFYFDVEDRAYIGRRLGVRSGKIDS